MIQISIVENDIGFAKKIKGLLNRFFFSAGLKGKIRIAAYPFISGNINWGNYCFLDTEIPDVERIVGEVKKQHGHIKITFVGESCNKENIEWR